MLPPFADLNLRMALQEQRIRQQLAKPYIERPFHPLTKADVFVRAKRRYTLREIHARKEFGFCLECHDLAREGHVYCERCAARRRANQQKRRNAAKHRTLVWFREKEAES